MQWLSYLQMFRKRPIVDEAVRARFVLGDRVSVRHGSPHEDGSPPYYLHGKSGDVEELRAAFTKSKPLAVGRSSRTPARQIYRVRFAAHDAWPESPGAPGDTLALDISEDWLEPSAPGLGLIG
jgi:hypothetical protein